MAESEENVQKFLDDLTKKSKPFAKKEWTSMQTFAKKHLNIKKIEKWDFAFVSEKLKEVEFDLNEEELKPYFCLLYTSDAADE